MMTSVEQGLLLLRRIAAGDDDAASEFNRRYRLQLVRFAQSRGIPAQDVDDVVQDVIVASIQKAKSGGFHGESSLGTWLIAILRNKISDYWKAHQRNVSRAGRDTGANTPEPAALSCYQPKLDDSIDFYRILDGLPQSHRVILLLNVTEQYTTDEIAMILNMKAGSVGRKLAEAKRVVRDALSEQPKRPHLIRNQAEESRD